MSHVSYVSVCMWQTVCMWQKALMTHSAYVAHSAHDTYTRGGGRTVRGAASASFEEFEELRITARASP